MGEQGVWVVIRTRPQREHVVHVLFTPRGIECWQEYPRATGGYLEWGAGTSDFEYLDVLSATPPAADIEPAAEPCIDPCTYRDPW